MVLNMVESQTSQSHEADRAEISKQYNNVNGQKRRQDAFWPQSHPQAIKNASALADTQTPDPRPRPRPSPQPKHRPHSLHSALSSHPQLWPEVRPELALAPRAASTQHVRHGPCNARSLIIITIMLKWQNGKRCVKSIKFICTRLRITFVSPHDCTSARYAINC